MRIQSMKFQAPSRRELGACSLTSILEKRRIVENFPNFEPSTNSHFWTTSVQDTRMHCTAFTMQTSNSCLSRRTMKMFIIQDPWVEAKFDTPVQTPNIISQEIFLKSDVKVIWNYDGNQRRGRRKTKSRIKQSYQFTSWEIWSDYFGWNW